MVERALDEALRRQMVKVEDLRWCLERNGRRGRAGIASFEALVEDRDAFGTTDSALETDVVAFLRAHGFPPHERGHEIIDRGRIVASVDFAWPDQRTVLLAHGSVHRQPRKWELDQVIENHLERLRWSSVRATRKMLDADPEGLSRALWHALRKASPG